MPEPVIKGWLCFTGNHSTYSGTKRSLPWNRPYTIRNRNGNNTAFCVVKAELWQNWLIKAKDWLEPLYEKDETKASGARGFTCR